VFKSEVKTNSSGFSLGGTLKKEIIFYPLFILEIWGNSLPHSFKLQDKMGVGKKKPFHCERYKMSFYNWQSSLGLEISP
jgi:hypothetical protein